MNIFINREQEIHSIQDPKQKGFVSIKISPEQMANLRSGKYKIDYTSKTLKLIKLSGTRDLSGDLDRFASAILKYFLKRMFELTTEQKVTLQSIKEYYLEFKQFPPIETLQQAEPELFKMVQRGIESGEIPPYPGS